MSTDSSEAQLKEHRNKLVKLLHSQMMDWKHNHPQKLEACVTTLLRMIGNILDRPEQEKFRSVSV